jgi:hypothetical protein
MRKYLTRRCVGLHAVVLVLVPAFLLAGWWQYRVALGGNELSWVYTVEWPLFAVYAVYIWWKLIHDESTPFDRLFAAKSRAAADAEGRPLHEIPGWATDKSLSREVHRTSREAAAALAGPRCEAVASARMPAGLMPAPADRADDREADLERDGSVTAGPHVVEAEVVAERVNVDEELDAYNRYLFELSRSSPPKRWSSHETPTHEPPDEPPTQERPALPATGGDS